MIFPFTGITMPGMGQTSSSGIPGGVPNQYSAIDDSGIAYAKCWLWSPSERNVDFTVGSDDGCRIWVGDEVVFNDASWHSARKDRKFSTCTLQKGWNTVLFKILNGNSKMGLYFRVLDDEIKSLPTKPNVN